MKSAITGNANLWGHGADLTPFCRVFPKMRSEAGNPPRNMTFTTYPTCKSHKDLSDLKQAGSL